MYRNGIVSEPMHERRCVDECQTKRLSVCESVRLLVNGKSGDQVTLWIKSAFSIFIRQRVWGWSVESVD